MKPKTIKTVILTKIKQWVESIEDKELQEMVKKNTIVTGGSIASMLLREPVNDFDIYFRDYATTLAVARYYTARFHPKNHAGIPCEIYIVNGMGYKIDKSPETPHPDGDRIKIVVKSAGVASEHGTEKPYEYFESSAEGEAGQYVGEVMQDQGEIQDTYEQTEKAAQETSDEEGKPKFRPVFLSTNAITLANKVQIVIRFWGEPDKIHENYDFVHCTNYWTSWDNNLVLRQPALESLLSKELKYVGSKYPICSIIRVRKFIQRQWTINAGQILKMIMQAGELDLNNVEVLQDQLTGVDSAYFCQVLAKMKEKDPEKINTAYLIEIIDRMF